MLIQKLRLKRGWSQQQLAEASGLSARTIQRVEAGHRPSIETVKSIAAVFEVDFSTLNPETAMNALNASPQEQQEREAFAYVGKLRRFYFHLLQYVVVCGALLAIKLHQSSKNRSYGTNSSQAGEIKWAIWDSYA